MLLTIGIPTLRRLAYLKEAIESALKMKGDDFEVLVSQDLLNGKLDPDIRNYLRSLSDSRIKVLESDRALGLAGNWNQIVDNASGEYVVLMGDDDRLHPDFFESMKESLRPEADVLFCNLCAILDNGFEDPLETKGILNRSRRDQMESGILVDAESWIWRNSIPSSSAWIRVSRAREIRFDEALNTPEIDFYIRLFQNRGVFQFHPGFLADYRYHTGSSTSAGLWSDKIAHKLISYPVSEHVEKLKQERIVRLLFNGVGRALHQGEWSSAKDLMKSPYYKLTGTLPGRVLQRLSHQLGPKVGSLFYKGAFKIWKTLKR